MRGKRFSSRAACAAWLVCLAVGVMATGRPALAARPKLAVMPLVGVRVDAEVTKILTDILTVRVSELGQYEVISADEVNAMLGMEKLKDALACDNVACAAEVGGALGVDYMLTGNVGKLGNQLNIKLALFDSKAMKVVRRILHQIDNDETLFSAGITAALRKVLGMEAGAVATVPVAAASEPGPTVPEGYDGFMAERREREAARAEAERAASERKSQLDGAWQLVASLGRDRETSRETREAALQKFLADFPDDNPYEKEARDLLAFFTHGRLVVETEPSGAEVMVDGERKGPSPHQALYPPGDYQISARMAGYFAGAKKVSLAAEKETRIRLLLEAVPMNPYKKWGHMSFWTGLGVGGVLAGIGHIGASVTAGSFRGGDLGARDANHHLSNVAVSGWVLAGAGMATGLILWLLSPGDDAWASESLANGRVQPNDGPASARW